jgi:hypothetical protein
VEKTMSFLVGFGEVDVTPSKPTLLSGYYFDRLSTGVHDPLRVRAMAVSDGRERVVLCVADLIDLRGGMNTVVPWIIPQARELVARQSGLAAGNVIFCAIHSHTAPDMSREKEFAATVPARLAEAVRLALADLTPRELRAGRDREPGLQFIRRYRMKDGGVRTNPGTLNPDIVAPIGTVDDDVHCLLASAGGKVAGGVAHYALHCDTVGGTEISADWTHYLREHARQTLGAEAALLTPIGPCGDVNHWNVKGVTSLRGFAETERIGGRIAAAALRAASSSAPVAAGPVRGVSKSVELPVRVPDAAELAEAEKTAAKPAPTDADFTMDRVEAFRRIRAARTGPRVTVDVTALAIGDLAVVAIPGEYFTELGRGIKARSPFKHTLVCTLANGNLGYIPARQNYGEGGYEAASAVLAPGSGEMLADAVVELLREVGPAKG